jgi:hypothetical protein
MHLVTRTDTMDGVLCGVPSPWGREGHNGLCPYVVSAPLALGQELAEQNPSLTLPSLEREL